jgi:flagellar biogenesis protein FliO
MKDHYYIKYILVLSILLVFAFAETLLADDVATPVTDVSTSDESSQTEGWKASLKESLSTLDTSETEKDSTKQAFFPKLTRVLQSTAIVIILIVGTVFLLKKKFGINKARGKKYIHVIESIPIGAKKFLLLVKIPGKLLVVGMANDRINQLAEITDKEVVETVSQSSGDNDFMGLMKRVYTEKCQTRAGARDNNQ